jgi:hypothetical protein
MILIVYKSILIVNKNNPPKKEGTSNQSFAWSHSNVSTDLVHGLNSDLDCYVSGITLGLRVSYGFKIVLLIPDLHLQLDLVRVPYYLP